MYPPTAFIESPLPGACIDVLVAGVAPPVRHPAAGPGCCGHPGELSGAHCFSAAERVGEGGTRLGPRQAAHDARRLPPVRASRPRMMTGSPAWARSCGGLNIDELPQLWCVLRGQMTLVGPRPESVQLAARYPAECRPVLMVRPGLTGSGAAALPGTLCCASPRMGTSRRGTSRCWCRCEYRQTASTWRTPPWPGPCATWF